MEPQQPDQKRRRPLNSIEDEIKPGDVDEDDDRAWQDWIDDDSGEKRAPLPPITQPEMGIHAPTPEMDEEDERRQEEYLRRRKKDEEGPGERGVWEMKQ